MSSNMAETGPSDNVTFEDVVGLVEKKLLLSGHDPESITETVRRAVVYSGELTLELARSGQLADQLPATVPPMKPIDMHQEMDSILAEREHVVWLAPEPKPIGLN